MRAGSTKHNALSKQEWLLSKELEQQNIETSAKIGMKQAREGMSQDSTPWIVQMGPFSSRCSMLARCIDHLKDRCSGSEVQ